MRLCTTLRLVNCIVLLGALTTGCSSTDSDEEMLEATTADEGAEAPDASEPYEAPVEPAPPPPPPPPPPPVNAPEPVKQTSTGAPEKDRVVRYVVRDSTPIFDQASAKGATVGALQKGDRLMVVMTGDWARLTDAMFVRSEDLSSQAVARTQRKASWIGPAE